MRYDIQDKRDSLFERLQDTYDDPIRNLYGLFKVGELLGGMMVYDFTMNFRGTMIHAGGAGCS